ncbi:hypothetical protein HPB52_006234 [Rhipicephalus sanguineus]|uniref:Uncharacterized protein n=1 Tax=Rhipicephalus sanguineus TaxID=34632 RepID=A0A9D4PQK5_RHISA|nr:hypothetical protein HPB52_006234 [Rhipicephalus sanguineus]
MDAEDVETEDGVGPSGYIPGPSGVAEASNNAHLRPPIPHTPWYRVVNARRRKVVAEEASATPPTPFHERERRHGTGRPRLPRLPAEDHKVVFRIRGGISLQQEAVLPLRAAIQTALRAPLPLEARIRVRKEQNIALISTSDPDLAEQLCHVQTLELGSISYEVSAYVASPDNSCKGVITGALPIPTEDPLMNDTVTYPQDLSDQSPKCATAASELATDTTSAHIRRNGGVEIAACLTQMSTTMVAVPGPSEEARASDVERWTPAPVKTQHPSTEEKYRRIATTQPTSQQFSECRQPRPYEDCPIEAPQNLPRTANLATYSTPSTSTHPDTGASIKEPPDTFFAVRRKKQRHVARAPATTVHPHTWPSGQSSGAECIWLGYRRSPKSSPTVAATATAGSPGRLR